MDHFSRAGLTFPVRDSGPAGGQPVVLLHGFPQDAQSYNQVVPRLVVTGLRTLVPTQRGYAAGGRPASRRAYRIRELAADVIALFDAAGLDQAHLVGHDWGGGIAWAVASWWPGRVRSLTVLSTPHPAAVIESMVRSDQALKSWYMAYFQLPWLPEWTLSRGLTRRLTKTGLEGPAAERYGRAMADRAQLTGALNWYRGLPFSSGATVADITVPTTYVWGRDDFALGRVAAERTARHVTGDYRFVSLDAGHWLPESHPTEVAEAILERIGVAT